MNAARSAGVSVSSRTRNAIETDSRRLAVSSALSMASVGTGSGSHGPTYSSRLARADFSRSRQRRVTTVVIQARADSSSSGAEAALSQVSWTTSSASAALLSMR